jgi:hypothetical protein
VLGQQKRREPSFYESLPTSDLSRIKLPEATQERLRRGVYTVMHWNETRGELERWYLNSAALQNVVGGRKPMIKAYLQAHAQEIEAHHQQFEPPIPRPIIANRFPLRSFLRCQNKRQPILGDGRRRRPLRKRSLRSKPSL